MFWKTNFIQSRSWTCYALLLGCFSLKSLPDVLHCVYWVLAEIWAPDLSHKIGDKLFIDHCQGWKEGSFVCETVWFFSWVNTHPFDLKFVTFCPEFSGESYVEFQEKTISYVVCTQLRSHVHKRITKRRYGEEKSGRFVFGKPVLFTLGLGLTTSYTLGVLVWNPYQTFFTVSIEFWLIFDPHIRPTRLTISFLLITARVERKVRSCVKLFDFLRGWILIRFTWNLLRFVPNSVEIFTWLLRKKTISGEFLRNFHANQGYPLPKHVIFRPTFCNIYFASVLRWKNSHKYFHMLFAPK